MTSLQPVGPANAAALGRFLRRLDANGDGEWFHPHPLNAKGAEAVAVGRGRDVYLVLIDEDEVVAYGLLRGWDEGYVVPSLGLAVDPARRGQGIAERMMQELHAVARERKSPKIRLKVYPSNAAAISLYTRLGYRFVTKEEGQLVGELELRR